MQAGLPWVADDLVKAQLAALALLAALATRLRRVGFFIRILLAFSDGITFSGHRFAFARAGNCRARSRKLSRAQLRERSRIS